MDWQYGNRLDDPIVSNNNIGLGANSLYPPIYGSYDPLVSRYQARPAPLYRKPAYMFDDIDDFLLDIETDNILTSRLKPSINDKSTYVPSYPNNTSLTKNDSNNKNLNGNIKNSKSDQFGKRMQNNVQNSRDFKARDTNLNDNNKINNNNNNNNNKTIKKQNNNQNLNFQKKNTNPTRQNIIQEQNQSFSDLDNIGGNGYRPVGIQQSQMLQMMPISLQPAPVSYQPYSLQPIPFQSNQLQGNNNIQPHNNHQQRLIQYQQRMVNNQQHDNNNNTNKTQSLSELENLKYRQQEDRQQLLAAIAPNGINNYNNNNNNYNNNNSNYQSFFQPQHLNQKQYSETSIPTTSADPLNSNSPTPPIVTQRNKKNQFNSNNQSNQLNNYELELVRRRENFFKLGDEPEEPGSYLNTLKDAKQRERRLAKDKYTSNDYKNYLKNYGFGKEFLPFEFETKTEKMEKAKKREEYSKMIRERNTHLLKVDKYEPNFKTDIDFYENKRNSEMEIRRNNKGEFPKAINKKRINT